MRIWYSGRAVACQATEASSNLAIRSKFYGCLADWLCTGLQIQVDRFLCKPLIFINKKTESQKVICQVGRVARLRSAKPFTGVRISYLTPN